MPAETLKAFEFTITTDTMHELPIYLTFNSLVIENDARKATLIFYGYASKAERERQVSNNSVGKFLQFPLVVEKEAYQTLFLAQVGGLLGLELSDLCWNLAKTTPFIMTFNVDEGNNLASEKKSLNDLNATEILIPLVPQE